MPEVRFFSFQFDAGSLLCYFSAKKMVAFQTICFASGIVPTVTNFKATVKNIQRNLIVLRLDVNISYAEDEPATYVPATRTFFKGLNSAPKRCVVEYGTHKQGLFKPAICHLNMGPVY